MRWMEKMNVSGMTFSCARMYHLRIVYSSVALLRLISRNMVAGFFYVVTDVCTCSRTVVCSVLTIQTSSFLVTRHALYSSCAHQQFLAFVEVRTCARTVALQLTVRQQLYITVGAGIVQARLEYWSLMTSMYWLLRIVLVKGSKVSIGTKLSGPGLAKSCIFRQQQSSRLFPQKFGHLLTMQSTSAAT